MTAYVSDYVSDDDILARVRLGDRNACLVLFHRYYARVEVYARLCSGNAEMAEEAACATFQQIYRATDDTGAESGLSCLCLLLLHCRRLIGSSPGHNATLAFCADNEADIAPTHPTPPLHSTEMPTDRVVLKAALSSLPREDREIIHLAFEPGLSRYDIAVLTDKPSTDAIASHLYSAMQKLAACIERHRLLRYA